MAQTSLIDSLNRQFSIPEVAQILTGRGGLAKIHVTSPAANAEIYLHGAHVTSWQPKGEDEVMFLSGRSHWEDGYPIRGGVPICFPWFRAKLDQPEAPTHGFVRTKAWALESITLNPDNSVRVICSTASDDSTRRWWPCDFRLIHQIDVGRALRLELVVVNTGGSAFRFEEALHTYLHVGLAQRAQIRGLDGAAYLDNTDGNRRKSQSGVLTLTKTTDNAYLHTEAPVELVDPVVGRVLTTGKENSASTVVWNPWREGAAGIADLGDEEWQKMTCVEASNVLECGVTLQPGQEHRMAAILTTSRPLYR